MKRKISKAIVESVSANTDINLKGRYYCAQPAVKEPEFSSDVSGPRLEAIFARSKEWANGTVLHYYLYKHPKEGKLAGNSDALKAVRAGFAKWKGLGIGLNFKEVDSASEAELKIGFVQGDGSWSFVGRDNLAYSDPVGPRTMNFGWPITETLEFDTVLHEIGHALGLNHEHQNPKAGIVWNESAVYQYFAGSPNFWDKNKTFNNILKKLVMSEVQGSDWDKNSIMHYPFGAGLISDPVEYRTKPLQPQPGLSSKDTLWVRTVYPSIGAGDVVSIKAHESKKLNLLTPGQANFSFVPEETRTYNFQAFGEGDRVLVLFEEVDGSPRYLAGDDDTGTPNSAALKAHLRKGRKYVLRVKVLYAPNPENLSVMAW